MTFFAKIRRMIDGYKIIRRWLDGGGMLVDYETGVNRVAVCRLCPCNQKGGFLDWLSRRLAQRIPLPKRSRYSRLWSCSKCGCDLHLKTQMPLTSILVHTSTDDLMQLPPRCWIRKESDV